MTKEEDSALRKRYEEGGLGYKEAKEMCAEAIIRFVSPMREKYNYYKAHPEVVKDILTKGAQRAEARAKTMTLLIRKKVGLDL